jgi:hypothetical protein
MLNYQRVYHISQFIAQGEGSQPAIPGMEEAQTTTGLCGHGIQAIHLAGYKWKIYGV